MFLPQVQLMELVEALVGVQAQFFRGEGGEKEKGDGCPPPFKSPNPIAENHCQLS